MYIHPSMTMAANGTLAAITYDGDGNRVAKTVSGVATKYLVDELNPTGYAQVVEELTTGAVSRTYTYGLQRISQEQVISSAWTPSFYGYDGGGSVRQLTNSADTVTDTYDYDAFGNLLNSTGTTPNDYMYRGEEWDSDLGLYYLRARYYNPLSGRFMSRDPLSGNGSDPKSLHKYIYADSDPVDLVDPTGEAAMIEFLLLQFRPGPLDIHYPTWCENLPAGLKSLFPSCMPSNPPTPPAPPGPPPNPPPPSHGYVAVALSDPDNTLLFDWAGRYVDYGIFELTGNSYCCQTHQFTVSLNERLVAGHFSGKIICNHGNCAEPGVFEDTQNVTKSTPYSVWRQWSINGSPIPVWDPKTSSPASYEVLHLTYGPHFTMDYGN